MVDRKALTAPSAPPVISFIRDRSLFEDMNDQVRMIRGRLAWKECRFDLRPCRVGSHGDEKVSSTKIPIDGQGILTELLHVVSAASERGG
jgi:hypothetical protein